ncbi:MAG: NmrA family NAD(P)-binding protein [Anaerolineales bacterium]|jgi:NADH dehydrogenase|nr:NmrA family NAD(P)-binding protein [Anaerolineales bacterium]
MILVIGGTGFIGRALVRHLVENDYPVRLLIHPSPHSPNLPAGLPVEVAVSSLSDERGLRSAMVDVSVVYHLATAEWQGVRASLLENDIRGSQFIAQAAASANVQRLFYLSHLGADRASAYPIFKAKAIAEEAIRRSGVNYTIIRSGIVFGPEDHFTTGLARMLSFAPFFFLLPGDGQTLLQPIWVEDLATALTWALDDQDLVDKTISVGGPEFLSFKEIVTIIMDAIGKRRQLLSLHPPYLRSLTVFLEHIFPGLPFTVYWLDYLAANRTCSLDTLPRTFHLMPSRFAHRLDYLHGQSWPVALRRSLTRRPKSG